MVRCKENLKIHLVNWKSNPQRTEGKLIVFKMLLHRNLLQYYIENHIINSIKFTTMSIVQLQVLIIFTKFLSDISIDHRLGGKVIFPHYLRRVLAVTISVFLHWKHNLTWWYCQYVDESTVELDDFVSIFSQASAWFWMFYVRPIQEETKNKMVRKYESNFVTNEQLFNLISIYNL